MALDDVVGRWALITGASRGIGRELALAAAQAGINVVAHSRRLDGTTSLVAYLRSMGVQAFGVAADLSDPLEVATLADEVLAKQQIDLLFNNAGANLLPGITTPSTYVDPMQYQYSYAVNLIAPALLIEKLLPGMLDRGFGRIINTTSGIIYQPCGYACSKGALNKLTLDYSGCLTGTGVTMNVVDPGWVRTELGGEDAPVGPETSLPGMLVGACTGDEVNGRWISAEDFTGMTLAEAVLAAPAKAKDLATVA